MKEQFLRSIAEHPDDDAPRLIYADWLEEQGESDRAELIRVQCKLAKIPEPPEECDNTSGLGLTQFHDEYCWRCRWVYEYGNHHDALWRRIRDLLHLHGYRWAGAAAEYIGAPRDWSERFQRGFLDSLSLPSSAWLTHGSAIVAEHPVLREVRFTDWEVHQTRLRLTLRPICFLAPRGRQAEILYREGETGNFLFTITPSPIPGWVQHEHDTESAAWSALSRAALDYARERLPASLAKK